MVLSTPVDLPFLKPDNWTHWWSLWEAFSLPLSKAGRSPNDQRGYWRGFDVYSTPQWRPVYDAVYLNMSGQYPSLYKSIMDVLPEGVLGIRFVQALSSFPAHKDNQLPSWQLRSLFYCGSASTQWYYTRMDGTDRRELILSPETNWWAYRDGLMKHGTDFKLNQPKILLQVFGQGGAFNALVERSLSRFDPIYQVDYD